MMATAMQYSWSASAQVLSKSSPAQAPCSSAEEGHIIGHIIARVLVLQEEGDRRLRLAALRGNVQAGKAANEERAARKAASDNRLASLQAWSTLSCRHIPLSTVLEAWEPL